MNGLYPKDYNKIQINYNVRKDKDGNTLEKSMMVNIREDDPESAVSLFKNLKTKLNGEMEMGNATITEEVIECDQKTCPECGSRLLLRVCKTGKNRGKTFFGCSAFPECKYILPV
jgi:ssDNA-binding Zn-finger/Zn-ribbon topoisomerase 1